MKKICLFLGCFFLFSCRVNSYNQEELEAANYLAGKGIIQDQSSNPSYYNFGETITRREILKIMIQISGKYIPTTCSTVHFQDLPASDWGCKYALVAMEEGYIADNTYFRPDDAITQIEALKMLMQAKGIERTNAIDWREGYINKAYQEGILAKNYLEYNRKALRSWIFTTGKKVYDVISNETNTQTFLPLGISEQTLQVGKDTRYYKVFTPIADVKNLPLVVFLHGGMGNMDVIETSGAGKILQELAKKDSFLIVTPNASDPETGMFHGEKNNWNDYRSAEQNAFFQNSRETQYTENIDDVGFIDALISQMQETYGVSKNNVFIFGVSNGGLMTQRYVLDGKTPIQAAAFLASNVPKLQENESYETKIPLLLWLGTADPLMKFPPQNDSTFPFLSGEESASWWTKQNAPLTQGTTETLSSVDTNACFTQRVIYSGEHPLYFYTSQGGGHGVASIKYPSEMGPIQKKIVGNQCSDIEEIEEVWEFFKKYVK